MREVLISRVSLIRWPVVDISHHLSFIGAVPNLNPQALSLFLSVSLGQLFAVYPLNIEGNYPPSPPSPTHSKELIVPTSTLSL